MPKNLDSFDPAEYAPVADRITLFYARCPTGRIISELVSQNEHEITFRALVYRSATDAQPAATGWASERIGDGEINSVACLENTETSAIGRALANLGLTASRLRPSLEEIEKADRARRALQTERRSASGRSGRGHASVTEPNDDLQRAADAASDALIILAEADRAGLDPAVSRGFRDALLSPTSEEGDVRRAERSLRTWLAGPGIARDVARHSEDADAEGPP